MNTKALCITVLIFTVLIFGANHYASRTGPQSPIPCEACECSFMAGAVTARKGLKAPPEPSCSVVFKLVMLGAGKTAGKAWELQPIGKANPPANVQLSTDEVDEFTTCNFAVFCDREREANIQCGGQTLSVKQGEKCRGRCVSNKAKGWVDITCGVWVNRRTSLKKKGSHSLPGGSWASSMFFAFTNISSSTVSRFQPAKYGEEATDDQEAKEIITGPTRWRLIEGEAGIDQGMLMVATGEAEARSFCTGDTIRLVGPSSISLPTCQPDVSGQWQGAYARRLPDGKLTPVTIRLNLRKESGSLQGELITSDGTFNIVNASQSGSDITLQAERTVAGAQEKITLQGNVTKGDIVFDGSEQPPSGAVPYRVKGFVRRLYIADSALPIAILNQPYTFALTTDSPNSDATTFRIAKPVPPGQITWADTPWTAGGSITGRIGERFTFLCPAKGTEGRIYGTDTYENASSICTAAVHSGLINQQAGGVITIQIQSGVSAYAASTRHGITSGAYGGSRGSFAFIDDGNGSKQGRLPKGLLFDPQSGTFSGTPTELGSFDLIVVADDGTGNVFEQPLTFTVKKLVVTNRLLPDGFVGQPYVAKLKIAGGLPPYRFSGSPPPGFQLDPLTGELSGKPSLPVSDSSFEVTIRDSQNNAESQKVSLSVRGTTILNSHYLPDAVVGVPYRTQFQAAGHLRPVHWVFGRHDASSIGLALNEGTGELSGTPTKAGDFLIEVRAEAGSGVSSRNFTITIKQGAQRGSPPPRKRV